jgi:hypothetical protein
MTTPNPMTAALDALRQAVAEAEAALAKRSDAGADMAERLALTGDAYAARLNLRQAEATNPRAAQAHRADLFAAALRPALADDQADDQAEKPPVEEPPADPWAEVDAAIAARQTTAEPAEPETSSTPSSNADTFTPTPEEAAFLAALNGPQKETHP